MAKRKTKAASKAKSKSPTKPLAGFAGPLVLLGAGKMGQAMLDGWLGRGLKAPKVIALDPNPSKEIKATAKRGVKVNPKAGPRANANAQAIVISVKPQMAPDAVPPLGLYVGKNTLVVSIMAGRTISFLEKALPPGTAIVRAMPNTPAAVGRGISVAVSNSRVTAKQRKLATDLLSAIGKVEWVNDEGLIDAVTATSGSGPAYVFLLVEAMAKAGAAAGLPADLAYRLARETVAGAGELLHQSALDAATLRQNVTSPGGTTAAALNVLMAPGAFDRLLTEAIAAATKRSKELAG